LVFEVEAISEHKNHELKVSLSLGLINLTPRHEDTWESGGIARLQMVMSVQLHALATLNPEEIAPSTHYREGARGSIVD
jgi:hypothetical protein